ncbi:hypothetical protein [Streptomyces sp. NPDC005141]
MVTAGTEAADRLSRKPVNDREGHPVVCTRDLPMMLAPVGLNDFRQRRKSFSTST